MPGIGGDQHWPSGGERNLLRTRPDQLGFGAIGIELAEDRQIGIAGVQCRIGVGTLRDFAPLAGQPAKTGGMVEGFAHLDGRTTRPFRSSTNKGSISAGS